MLVDRTEEIEKEFKESDKKVTFWEWFQSLGSFVIWEEGNLCLDLPIEKTDERILRPKSK